MLNFGRTNILGKMPVAVNTPSDKGLVLEDAKTHMAALVPGCACEHAICYVLRYRGLVIAIVLLTGQTDDITGLSPTKRTPTLLRPVLRSPPRAWNHPTVTCLPCTNPRATPVRVSSTKDRHIIFLPAGGGQRARYRPSSPFRGPIRSWTNAMHLTSNPNMRPMSVSVQNATSTMWEISELFTPQIVLDTAKFIPDRRKIWSYSFTGSIGLRSVAWRDRGSVLLDQ